MATKQYLDAANIAGAMRGYKAVFDSTIEQVEDPIMACAMEVPSDSDTEEYDWFTDVPGLVRWLDERPLSKLAAKMMRIENYEWVSGITLRRLDILNDKIGKIMPKVKSLAQKAALMPAELIGDMIVNGHTANAGTVVPWSNGKSFDAVTFFHASHPNGSSTYSNVGTAALDALGVAFNAAYLVMMSYVDESLAHNLRVRPTHLIVGPSLRSVAFDVTKNDKRPMAGATGDVAAGNPNQGIVDVIVTPTFVGSYANYWCLADLSHPIKPLIYQNREPISTSELIDGEVAFMKGEYRFGAQRTCGFGYGDPHYLWGSDGTA